MSLKYTIEHNGHTWNSIQNVNSVDLSNGSVTESINSAGTRVLHCAGKVVPNNLVIGAKTLNCLGKKMYADVSIIVENSIDYLTFTSPTTFSITPVYWGYGDSSPIREYSTDDGSTWSIWSTGTTVNGIAGGNIKFRATGCSRCSYTDDFVYGTPWGFSGSNISCTGNIETILDYTVVASGNHPAMALCCCWGMFRNWTSLLTAPKLPAITLTSVCYTEMFEGCTSLTTAPELPADTLAENCYAFMFKGCTSLTTAPELPATTLYKACYNEMFQGCSNLKIRNSSASGATLFFTCPSTIPTRAVMNMFNSTGGSYTSNPVANGTYYYY